MRCRVSLLFLVVAAAGCSAEPEPECYVNTECPTRSLCIEGYCESLDGPMRDGGTDSSEDATQDIDADDVAEDAPEDAGCVPTPEICDGRDNDCDGVIDGQTVDLEDCTPLVNARVTGCIGQICRYRCQEGWVDQNGDLGTEGSDGCERGADCLPEEVRCDSVDDDCDGVVDEGCDDDEDGYCDPAMARTDEAACLPNDCDDDDPGRSPGLSEICNGRDDNCAEDVDEGCDDDDDGWCDAALAVGEGFEISCPEGTGDCDDDEPFVYPGAEELCDGLRNDCAEGEFDLGCDDDDDGWVDVDLVPVRGPRFDALYPGGENDCDDENPAIYPGAVEICDGRDNDCTSNTPLDDGCDDDVDGYCDADLPYVEGADVLVTCPNGPADCNDNDDVVFPGRVERCDGIDNDCAGEIDEGCDDDLDGHCDANLEFEDPAPVCTLGFRDCDDNNPNAYPRHPELCDGADNDCDERTDEDDPDYDHPCPLQEGVCAGSQVSCLDGVPQPCNYAAHDPRYSDEPGFGELLFDDLDNDCDGERDETFGDDCAFTLDGEDENRTTRAVAVSRGGDGLWAVAWTESATGFTGQVRVQVLDQATGTVLQDAVVARTAATEPALRWLPEQQLWLVVWLSLGQIDSTLVGATLSAQDGLSAVTVVTREFGDLHAPDIAVTAQGIAVGALSGEPGDSGALICTGASLGALSCAFRRTLNHVTNRRLGLGRLRLLYAGSLFAIYPTDTNLYFTSVENDRLPITSVSDDLGLEFGGSPWTHARVVDSEVRVGWAAYDRDSATIQRGVWNPFNVDGLAQSPGRSTTDMTAFTAAFDPDGSLEVWHDGAALRAGIRAPILARDLPDGFSPVTLDPARTRINLLAAGRPGPDTAGVEALFLHRDGHPICPSW